MNLLFKSIIFVLVVFWFTGCDVSFSGGGIEDMDAPKVVEDLEPLSAETLEFAQQVVRLFYAERTYELVNIIHENVAEDLNAEAIVKMYRFKSEGVETMDYYGHGFGQEVGLDLTTVQFKLPRDSGYDLVRVVLAADPDCCQIAGLHVEKKFIKTLFGD